MVVNFEGWKAWALIAVLLTGGFFTGYKTAKVPAQCPISISQ